MHVVLRNTLWKHLKINSYFLLINQSINQLMNQVFLDWLIASTVKNLDLPFRMILTLPYKASQVHYFSHPVCGNQAFVINTI